MFVRYQSYVILLCLTVPVSLVFWEYPALEASTDVFIYTTAQSYHWASSWPQSNTVHDYFSLRDTITVSLVERTHLLVADFSMNSIGPTLKRWRPFVNKVISNGSDFHSCYPVHISRTMQWLWAFECFWHRSSHRGREPNNCCDIPNGLIPFNFSVFLLLPDPDHILPHCGEGNILQWVKRFIPNCWKSREAGCKLWSQRLKPKYY